MVLRVFAAFAGAPDFHIHLRLRWLQRFPFASGAWICELGAGSGIALIEVLRSNSSVIAWAREANDAAIQEGRVLAAAAKVESRLQFELCNFNSGLPRDLAQFDYLLLLDVIEHLRSPQQVAAEIVKCIRPGAIVLVSVPTPLYPKVFGRTYHEAVGHVHEGFNLEDVDDLFSGLQRVQHRYSTGPLSWPGVALNYRLFSQANFRDLHNGRLPLITRLGILMGLPFRFVDWWNGPRLSCSLFVEYRKPE